MHSRFLTYKNSTIHYSIGAEGYPLVICFHGYGEKTTHFNFLEPHLSGHFTLLAIDMPYHGQTVWKEGPLLTIAMLSEIILAILEKHTDPLHPVTLLGYSMGGRIALTLFQQADFDIGQIILLAPDGLKVNFWYWLSTQTRFGNKLFAATIKHPTWFLHLVETGYKLKILNNSIYKFVKYYLHDPNIRKQLYLRWTCFRELSPSIPVIISKIKKSKTPVTFFYGQYDRIITPQKGETFSKKISPLGSLIILPCGHKLLEESNAGEIVAKCFMSKARGA